MRVVKTRIRIATALACSAWLCLTGCESKKTSDAGLDGMMVKDGNGRYWILNHNIGDTYFLKEVKTNSFLH